MRRCSQPDYANPGLIMMSFHDVGCQFKLPIKWAIFNWDKGPILRLVAKTSDIVDYSFNIYRHCLYFYSIDTLPDHSNVVC